MSAQKTIFRMVVFYGTWVPQMVVSNGGEMVVDFLISI